jgi:two-component system, chemotaxis family, CheB/CheR fusion protein
MARPESHAVEGDAGQLRVIFNTLNEAFGVDFSAYRLATIRRRIARRMLLLKVEDPEAYAALVRRDPAEAEALFHDLLITVTSFFREPETFGMLTDDVLPRLARDDAAPVRAWVAGCATGEEAYTVAILLARACPQQAKVFATDIDERCLQAARRGVYGEQIREQVTPQVLASCFTHTEGGYRIGAEIREQCIFARHDLTVDPPFANLDLVTCRNVLIYLRPSVQRSVLAAFHFALRSGGYLLLGHSETLGALSDAFETVDARRKLFRKLPSGRSPVAGLQAYPAFPSTAF